MIKNGPRSSVPKSGTKMPSRSCCASTAALSSRQEGQMNKKSRIGMMTKVLGGVFGFLCLGRLLLGCTTQPLKTATATPSVTPATPPAPTSVSPSVPTNPPLLAVQLPPTNQEPDWSKIADELYVKIPEKEEKEHAILNSILDKVKEKAIDKE